jgi:hypothetical protein
MKFLVGTQVDHLASLTRLPFSRRLDLGQLNQVLLQEVAQAPHHLAERPWRHWPLGLAIGRKPFDARIFWPSGERMVRASSIASGFAAFITASPYCGPIVRFGGKATILRAGELGEARLARACSTAWRPSGYPMVNVRDIESGKVRATRNFFGAD